MKKILTIIMLLPVCLCCAQASRGMASFKKGDVFEKRFFTVSDCWLQQGSQRIDISSSSAVTRQYKVTDADSKGLAITVQTSQIIDTINSMGQQMVYQSQQAPDTASLIQNALSSITKTPVSLAVGNDGIISRADGVEIPGTSSVILAYAGIQGQPYNAGDELGITTSFEPGAAYQKGFRWTDSTEKNGVKAVITYTIESTSPEATGVSFEGTISEDNFTTNLNGVLAIDNATGIIMKKLMQTASTGFDFAGNVGYSEARRTATVEYYVRSK